ncbi:alpha/beta family hydrolase [Flexibacterium corallicola]|uniref:alpha/beta family hydrolase n=1 Tax=Flexibacterium corallicola TaxID=3037259 RepID=UPI00286F3F50|nr:alpha/beta family hydrolase [Pseudovibrio sp. M1P-2-3]
MENYILNKAENEAQGTFLFAHGAGAPMDSPFMERITLALTKLGVNVARFEFKYMAKRRISGKKSPPPRADKLIGEYQKILQALLEDVDGPIVIGGKSMGSRIAAMLASANSLPKRVTGVCCLGYPFHPVGKSEIEHWRLPTLEQVKRPMLILQGERDQFGNKEELTSISLPKTIELAFVEDGNHDFAPRGRSEATLNGNLNNAAQLVSDFIRNSK